MTCERVCSEVRTALNGRPGEPIVFGVCHAISRRTDKEPWVVRAIAIALGLFWTLPTLAAYVVLGFVLSETETRTRRFFSGLTVLIREKVEEFAAWLRATLQAGERGHSGGRY